MTERDAQREGVTSRVPRLPISVVKRAHTTDEREGFMKALVGDDDRILGFTMIGAEADGDDGRANGDAGQGATFDASRRHSDAPDHG